MSYMDATATMTNPPNPIPLLKIPSQSIELECGAKELAAAATTALALAALF